MADEVQGDESPLPERVINWQAQLRNLLGQDPPEGLLMLFQETIRRGPLPDPETLRAYSDIDPRLLETILAEFQAEAKVASQERCKRLGAQVPWRCYAALRV
jgi:hypothetical protein